MTDVSVILCTRNRSAALPAAVRSIVAASIRSPHVDVEILCVDNGSQDDTREVLAALAAEADGRVTVLEEPVRGVARAKNLALRQARGRVIVLTDDDCVMHDGYFNDLVAHYAETDGPMLLGGRIDLGDPADQPFTIRTDLVPDIFRGAAHPGGFIHGCNLTMSRAAFERIGFFDERFGPGGRFKAAEDTDYVYRAFKQGIPARYVPDMAVSHFHGRKSLSGIHGLNDGYHYGNGALHAKYGLFDPLLFRSFWWIARNAIRERLGGGLFDPRLEISNWNLVKAHLAGFLAYVAAPERS